MQAEAGRDSSSSAQSHGWQALGKAAHREITDRIRARQLVPVETVRLTEHRGFVEAIEAGVEALSDAAEFHSVLDIVKAREKKITRCPSSARGTVRWRLAARNDRRCAMTRPPAAP